MQRATPDAHPDTPDPKAATFMRLPSVMRWTGLGRSTIYRLVAERKFPAPVLLAARAVAWRRTDLEQWSEMRQTATH